jgi:hypothetical protein
MPFIGTWCSTVMAQRAEETAMNGTVIFHRRRAAKVNGVTKDRTLLGSKLLTLAKLPRPKKERSVRK